MAENRREVAGTLEKCKCQGLDRLDFEQFLEIVGTREGAKILKIFKEAMVGRLGDRRLDFQTLISQCRRNLILDSTGARCGKGAGGERQEHGTRVLRNYVALVRGRRADAASLRCREEGAEEDEEEQARIISGVAVSPALAQPFETDAAAPLGGLELVWRSICHEHHLVSSRPNSAERRRAFEMPPSPSAVLASLVKVQLSKNKGKQNRTIIVHAPAYTNDEGGKRNTTAVSE